jgi:hypothetical protein
MLRTKLGSQVRDMFWRHAEGAKYAAEISPMHVLKVAYGFPLDPFRTILGKALTHYSDIYFGYACARWTWFTLCNPNFCSQKLSFTFWVLPVEMPFAHFSVNLPFKAHFQT